MTEVHIPNFQYEANIIRKSHLSHNLVHYEDFFSSPICTFSFEKDLKDDLVATLTFCGADFAHAWILP